MLRKFLLTSLVLSLFIILAESEVSAQTRVKFNTGGSSKRISSTIKPNASREFVLQAFEGQEIKLTLISKNDRVKVEGEGGMTENVFDAIDGANVIRVYNDSKYRTRFSATFTITDIVNAPEKRVEFDKGKSSKMIKSTIGGNLVRVFVLNAREGQEIEAKITSKNKRVMINEEEGARWLKMDAKQGDNKIEVVNKSNKRSAYAISFAIREKKRPAPTRITFDKGKYEKTIDLTMNRYQKEKRFVVGASAVQTINILIGSDSERVTLNLENGGDIDDWLDGSGYLRISTGRDGDFIFSVRKADDVFFQSKMKISIVDNK